MKEDARSRKQLFGDVCGLEKVIIIYKKISPVSHGCQICSIMYLLVSGLFQGKIILSLPYHRIIES